jgi:type IV pilus assembly protein PilB
LPRLLLAAGGDGRDDGTVRNPDSEVGTRVPPKLAGIEDVAGDEVHASAPARNSNGNGKVRLGSELSPQPEDAHTQTSSDPRVGQPEEGRDAGGQRAHGAAGRLPSAAPAAPGGVKQRLGDLLREDKQVGRRQLSTALRRQRRDHRRLGEVLVELGVPSIAVTRAVAKQMAADITDLDGMVIDERAIERMDGHVARELNVIPTHIDDAGYVHIATADPLSPELHERLSELAPVHLDLADAAAIQRALDRHYTVLGKVDAAAQRAAAAESVAAPATAGIATLSADAPVVQIVNLIITQGLRDRVSDIHIEPQADRLRIRFRVDGALQDVQSLPTNLAAPIASRLKILADMDIVDRHRSQDGQTTMKLDGRDIDIRIATIETLWGEKVVLRLLDRSRSLLPLKDLGLREGEHDKMRRMISSPYGLLIVSGPTGAGKTTTLYAALNELDRKTRNITTIEDPVEYQFENINQVQINRLAGMTFANGLRAILRQDPDVILVGEVRDVETAQIAVQSALTGHLVLCSLHAADCVGALHRFLDMGLEGFLVASAVIGVVAQRLVRVNCPHCAQPLQPSPEEIEFYESVRAHPPIRQFAGTGCKRCNQTGFFDRTGVFEAMTVDDSIRELIVGRATQVELRRHAQAAGMRTLQESACDLIDGGQTSLAEAMRTVYVI